MIRPGIALTCAALVSACGNSAPETDLGLPGLEGDSLTLPLTDQPGDKLSGQDTFQSRDGGHCVLCHRIENLSAEFQGNVGPDLTLVGDRLTPEQIRLRIVDYEQVLSGVTMPSYFRIHGLHQVGDEFQGETILTAQQIEDLVAFLSDQKERS